MTPGGRRRSRRAASTTRHQQRQVQTEQEGIQPTPLNVSSPRYPPAAAATATSQIDNSHPAMTDAAITTASLATIGQHGVKRTGAKDRQIG